MDYETNTNPNMKPCETCGQLIAKSAKKCPHCGAKVKQPIYKNGCLISLLIMVVLILGVFASCMITSSLNQSKEPQVTIVNNNGITEHLSAKELKELYSSNKVKFDNLYLGAEVTVIGEIVEIGGKSIHDGHHTNAYIEIGGYGEWFFELSSASIASQFEVGDTVIAKGNIWSAFGTKVDIYIINNHKTSVKAYNE